MEDESKKTNKYTVECVWGKITICSYLTCWVLISLIQYIYAKSSIYSNFYENLVVQFLYFPGILFFVFGYLINKLLCLKNTKKYFSAIVISILICIIAVMGFKFNNYSGFYNYYNDYKYVISDSYCGEEEELLNVYTEVIHGKIIKTRLYIVTTNHKFEVYENIVTEDKYNEFVEKYKDVKKVRIKYLPNTKSLISIEPADYTGE